jgi:hypothetical protein
LVSCSVHSIYGKIHKYVRKKKKLFRNSFLGPTVATIGGSREVCLLPDWKSELSSLFLQPRMGAWNEMRDVFAPITAQLLVPLVTVFLLS